MQTNCIDFILMIFLQPWFLIACPLFAPLSEIREKGKSDWPKSMIIRIGDNSCQNGPVFHVKSAQTELEREHGLSRRVEPLGSREGMLFIWKNLEPGYFWMKDTWIPLSLLFFDGGGKLITGLEMPVEQDPAHPKSTYNIPSNANFALELKGGSTKHFLILKYNQLCIKIQN